MSEDLMLERLRRMDHKFDGLIEDMRGIRLDVQEIKTRIALIERGYAPKLILSRLTVYSRSLSGKMRG